MSKIKISYIDFRNAPKATKYSRTTSFIGWFIWAFAGLLILLGVALIFEGDFTGIPGCLLAVAMILGYRYFCCHVIYPRLFNLAEKERKEFAEMIRRANEDPVEPEIDQKKLLLEELNKLLDADEVNDDELRRIGELTVTLEAMGVKFD